ncbi:MAG: GNAT family N-acetyltransferase [Erysipelotrichaceae bacterium]|nr:GNAT family N-acetyltransferase [Erysipelotrichaceae bacterium]
MFAIRLKETGKLIGTILSFGEKDDHCEIGYALSSRYWNRGYMSEAVTAFLDCLFAEKGFKRIYASYFTGNEASRRVMEKCGMTYDRFVERELEYLGQPRDVVYYVIDRDRWQALRNSQN